MSLPTIPDAVIADLQDFYLSDPPAGLDLDESRLRFLHAAGEPPSPRLVILAGDPRAQYGMEETSTLPVEIHYITSADRVTADEHRAAAGILDAWWRSLRAAKRREVLSTRIYLHDHRTLHPVTEIDAESREQVTILRGSMVVTLMSEE